MSNDLARYNHEDFREIILIIERARDNAFRAVNRELITMYWKIGEYVSKKVKAGAWGNSIIDDISGYIKSHLPTATGFSPQNLRRMRQFYDTYKDFEFCSAVLSKLSWTCNVAIMSKNTKEAREFYLTLATKNNYSSRELIRQIDSCLYERTMISKNLNINELLVKKFDGLSALRDSYVFEFLDLPKKYKEVELQKAIIYNLRDFILEFGKDFTFVGEEYRVQVGNSDFYVNKEKVA